jgi:hypothetical protein
MEDDVLYIDLLIFYVCWCACAGIRCRFDVVGWFEFSGERFRIVTEKVFFRCIEIDTDVGGKISSRISTSEREYEKLMAYLSEQA